MADTEETDQIPLLFDHGVTFRITGVANRLNRSAAVFYREIFGIGLPEWRMMLALGKTPELKVGMPPALLIWMRPRPAGRSSC